jgi:hypothetical protein
MVKLRVVVMSLHNWTRTADGGIGAGNCRLLRFESEGAAQTYQAPGQVIYPQLGDEIVQVDNLLPIKPKFYKEGILNEAVWKELEPKAVLEIECESLNEELGWVEDAETGVKEWGPVLNEAGQTVLSPVEVSSVHIIYSRTKRRQGGKSFTGLGTKPVANDAFAMLEVPPPAEPTITVINIEPVLEAVLEEPVLPAAKTTRKLTTGAK